MLRYDFYSEITQNSRRLVAKNGKFGFVNESCENAIPLLYEDATDFSGGYAMAKIDKSWGIIDTYGRFVVPCVYDFISRLDEDKFIAKIYGKMALINVNNQVVTNEYYDEIEVKKGNYLSARKGDKFGVIDECGNVIVPVIYDNVLCKYESIYVVAQNGKLGAIDSNNNIVFSFIYDEIKHLFEDIMLIRQDNRYGIARMDGVVIVHPSYKAISTFEKHLYELEDFDGKKEIISDKGEILLPKKYDSIKKYAYNNRNIYIVKDKGKYAALNDAGEMITDFVYDFMDYWFNSWLAFTCGVLIVGKDDKFGLISIDGKKLSEIEYDTIYWSSDKKIAIVEKNNKQGCINIQGKEIVPVRYDNVNTEDFCYIIVEKNSKYGVYADDGRKLTDPIYSKINKNVNAFGRSAEVILNNHKGIVYFK